MLVVGGVVAVWLAQPTAASANCRRVCKRGEVRDAQRCCRPSTAPPRRRFCRNLDPKTCRDSSRRLRVAKRYAKRRSDGAIRALLHAMDDPSARVVLVATRALGPMVQGHRSARLRKRVIARLQREGWARYHRPRWTPQRGPDPDARTNVKIYFAMRDSVERIRIGKTGLPVRFEPRPLAATVRSVVTNMPDVKLVRSGPHYALDLRVAARVPATHSCRVTLDIMFHPDRHSYKQRTQTATGAGPGGARRACETAAKAVVRRVLGKLRTWWISGK